MQTARDALGAAARVGGAGRTDDSARGDLLMEKMWASGSKWIAGSFTSARPALHEASVVPPQEPLGRD